MDAIRFVKARSMPRMIACVAATACSILTLAATAEAGGGGGHGGGGRGGYSGHGGGYGGHGGGYNNCGNGYRGGIGYGFGVGFGYGGGYGYGGYSRGWSSSRVSINVGLGLGGCGPVGCYAPAYCPPVVACAPVYVQRPVYVADTYCAPPVVVTRPAPRVVVVQSDPPPAQVVYVDRPAPAPEPVVVQVQAPVQRYTPGEAAPSQAPINLAKGQLLEDGGRLLPDRPKAQGEVAPQNVAMAEGWNSLGQGKPLAAQTLFRTAIETATDKTQAYLGYAISSALLGRDDIAASALRRATELDPAVLDHLPQDAVTSSRVREAAEKMRTLNNAESTADRAYAAQTLAHLTAG